MTKTFTIENGQKPTVEQLKEIEEAKKHPITFDEDCPGRRKNGLRKCRRADCHW